MSICVHPWLILFLVSASAFGQSALHIDLSGLWRMSADDRPEYASADFDDSSWAPAQLPWTVPLPNNAFWLRRTVDLPEWADRRQLAITIGPVREMYELYINGVLAGKTGPLVETDAQIARDRTFAIPEAAVAGSGRRMAIAIRTMAPKYLRTLVWAISSGGQYLISYMSNAPLHAGEETINRQRVLYSPQFVLALLLLYCGMQLFLFWLAERSRMAVFWLGMTVASRGIRDTIAYFTVSVDSFPWRQFNSSSTLSYLGGAATAELVMAAVDVRNRWLHLLVWSAAFLPAAIPALATPEYLHCRSAITLAILGTGWWRKGALRQPFVGHLTALLLCLYVSTQVNSSGGRLYRVFWDIGGRMWSTQSLSIAILSALLTVLLLRQLMADRREKMRLAGEMEAARIVQQLLLSSQSGQPAHYAVEVEYTPADEVGGDFYQVLPLENGDLLVAVGDVSGKGLKAAMVVAMMTGVLRNRRECGPAALLAEMNRTLAGSFDSGFVTCVIARFPVDGPVIMANAGHLSPYRDRGELVVESGLPLGIAADAEYGETSLPVAVGETITFVTDGIVEAANPQTELFGFERTCEISSRPALEIANAAKAWGQNDDITVVTVRRLG